MSGVAVVMVDAIDSCAEPTVMSFEAVRCAVNVWIAYMDRPTRRP
jgi:hypothetical protein